jgi:hypothetical protein
VVFPDRRIIPDIMIFTHPAPTSVALFLNHQVYEVGGS